MIASALLACALTPTHAALQHELATAADTMPAWHALADIAAAESPALGGIAGRQFAAAGDPPNLTAATAAEAAPAAPGGGYRVRVASKLTDQSAANFERSLKADGYDGVVIERKPDGITIYVGSAATREQAEAVMNDLAKVKGYSPEGIDEPSAAAPASGAPATGAAAANEGAFRVQVGEYRDGAKDQNEENANRLREALLADDYVNITVEPSGAQSFRVLLGSFTSQQDAVLAADALRRTAGYNQATVVSGGAGASTAASMVPFSVPTVSTDDMSRLSPDQRARLEALLRDLQAAENQPLTFEKATDLRVRQKQAQQEFGDILTKAKQGQSALAEREKKVFELYGQFNRALLDQDYALAEKKLAEVETLSPDDSLLGARKTRLEQQRSRAEKASTPEGAAEAAIDNLRNSAKNAFDRKDYQLALQLYTQLQAQAPQDAEASSRIAELKGLVQQARTAGAAAPAAARPPAGVIAGIPKWALYAGAGVLAVLAVMAFLLFKNKRHEKQLIREVQELSAHSAPPPPSGSLAGMQSPTLSAGIGTPSTPAPNPLAPKPSAPAGGKSALAGGSSVLAGASALAGADMLAPTPPPPTGTQEEKPEKLPILPPAPTPEPVIEARPHGEADVLILHDIHSETPSMPLPATAAMNETIPLEGLDIPMPGGVDDFPSLPEKLDLPEIPSLPDLSIDDLVKAEPESAPVPPPQSHLESISLEMPDIPEPMISTDTTSPETLVPLPPTSEPPVVEISGQAFAPTEQLDAVKQSAPAAMPPAPKLEDGVYFTQDFDAEPLDAQAQGWQGEYDYASLTVVEDADGDTPRRCLKFEKRTGSGSANYVCRFPKAAGRVIVEFDIRCDDKNKYLLGFYVEKDEDFKQSVHTIVHRTDSKTQPTLRIQGEPVPYNLGSWCHLKYDMNLLAGLVTAFVDGKQVVRDAKLPTNPAFVNTLSIRDNLATTGVLYLDNIKIYKG